MRDRGPAAVRRFRVRVAFAVLGTAALLTAVPAAGADYYRWVDENGERHYSDRRPDVEPPGGVEGPPPVTVEELRKRDREEARRREAEARREREARQAREKRAEEMAREMNEPKIESPYDCTEARHFLAFYSEGDSELYRRDKKGAFHPMTAKEVAAMVAQWKHAVELLCKKPNSEESASAQ